MQLLTYNRIYFIKITEFFDAISKHSDSLNVLVNHLSRLCLSYAKVMSITLSCQNIRYSQLIWLMAHPCALAHAPSAPSPQEFPQTLQFSGQGLFIDSCPLPC